MERTEGKWTWHDNDEIEIHPVGDEDYGDHTIAVMCEDGYYNREIALANAHLIAAAPDLLAACELALAKFRLMYEKIEAGYDAEDLYTDSKSWPLTTLRNAIKKAKTEN